jgi:hypothetical protein
MSAADIEFQRTTGIARQRYVRREISFAAYQVILSRARHKLDAAQPSGKSSWQPGRGNPSNCRNRSFPALLILPRRRLPPVECSRGTSPSHAAKWRPDSKLPGSIVTATVTAVIGPTPGISLSSRPIGLSLWRATSCRFSDSTFASRSAIAAPFRRTAISLRLG